MCKKVPYCNTKIDECIRKAVSSINKAWKGTYETVGSCYGHEEFPTTIIVHDLRADTYFEWFSKTPLDGKYKNGNVRKRWYVRRGKFRGSLYYLPEVKDF